MGAAMRLRRIPDAAGPRLSASEVDYASEAKVREEEARKSALAIHDKATERAADARARLLELLPKDDAARERIAAAVDAHARAQCWLREAAQAVCDICDFADNGRAAGVIWETPLAQEADRG